MLAKLLQCYRLTNRIEFKKLNATLAMGLRFQNPNLYKIARVN